MAVFAHLDHVMLGGRSNTVIDKYPEMMAHYELVKSNKNIAEWLDNRPKSDV